jgi:hypothetical protein
MNEGLQETRRSTIVTSTPNGPTGTFNDFLSQIRSLVFPGWLTFNWLLIVVPFGVLLRLVHASPVAVFITNFIAIIPLASIINNTVDDLDTETGPGLAVFDTTFR